MKPLLATANRTTGASASPVDPIDKLYERHLGQVKRWARHLAGPTADLEDLVHDIFLVALRKGFGFRGEALPSIASVSRFELASAEQDGAGHRLRCEFGVIKEVLPAARAQGTTITVRDLFAQLPARKRFLKATETEHAHLWGVITRLALATPEVHWTLTSDRSGQLVLPVVPVAGARLAPASRWCWQRIAVRGASFDFVRAGPGEGVSRLEGDRRRGGALAGRQVRRDRRRAQGENGGRRGEREPPDLSRHFFRAAS